MAALLNTWRERFGDDLPLAARSPKKKEIDLTGRERIPDRWQPEWIREKYFGGREPTKRRPRGK